MTRRVGFAAMLPITMAVSVMAFFALAVAATELQDEFGISKLQLGLLGAVNTGVGGLFAPKAGELADRLGGRVAMAATLFTSGATAVAIALSQSYGMLLFAMALAGIPQGWGNPACNKAISTGFPANEKGLTTGIKQSGVQLAVFLTGFAVPWLSINFGWRSAIWVTAAISFGALAGTSLITEIDDEAAAETDSDRSNEDSGEHRPPGGSTLPFFVTQVAIFGFLLGIVGGGLGRFLPLFAEEEVGFSIEQAGRVFGLQGLVAIPFRLLSGTALDRGVSARTMLFFMGVGGAGAVLLILAAGWVGAAVLWIGTIFAGMTIGSWNTAANLSMIRQGANAGRATGRLMLGFLTGLTVGGPVVGWSIDSYGYTPAWVASAILALAGAAVVGSRTSEKPSVPLAGGGAAR